MFWCVGDGIWQHRRSLDEFGFGSHVACGPTAHELLMANMQNRAPTYANMRAVMDRDSERGWFDSGGQTFSELVSDFESFEPSWPISKRLDFRASGYARSDMLALIEAPYGRNAGNILQVGRASFLPHNEGFGLQPGQAGFIYQHFVALLAYNSATGHVLLANGDREPHSDLPDWVSVDDIMRALPEAGLVLDLPMPLPQGWKDDGSVLTSPNGKHAELGFRDWILGHAWDSADWIIQEETPLASVELGNPSIGTGTRLLTRKHMLGWTKARGVYEAWIGQELMAREAAKPDYQPLLTAFDALDREVNKLTQG